MINGHKFRIDGLRKCDTECCRYSLCLPAFSNVQILDDAINRRALVLEEESRTAARCQFTVDFAAIVRERVVLLGDDRSIEAPTCGSEEGG